MKSLDRDAKFCGVMSAPAAKRCAGRAPHVKICDPMRIWFIFAFMVRQSDTPASIEFGHFSIFPHRRELLAGGRPIPLGGRAFDVLMTLIEASGGCRHCRFVDDAGRRRFFPPR